MCFNAVLSSLPLLLIDSRVLDTLGKCSKPLAMIYQTVLAGATGYSPTALTRHQHAKDRGLYVPYTTSQRRYSRHSRQARVML